MIHIQNNQKAACNGKKREEKKNQLFRQELITKPATGSPKAIEKDALISTITDIVIATRAANKWGRTKITNTCKTLDKLVEKLKGFPYNMKHNSVYFQLIPRRKDSIEDQCHRKVCFTSFMFKSRN